MEKFKICVITEVYTTHVIECEDPDKAWNMAEDEALGYLDLPNVNHVQIVDSHLIKMTEWNSSINQWKLPHCPKED